MPDFILLTLKLCGILLILIGVFVFANAFAGRSSVVGDVAFGSDVETGFFAMMLGMILFGAAAIISKFVEKRK